MLSNAERARAALAFLLWGLVIRAVDLVDLGGFDLLPDVAGLVFVATALLMLTEEPADPDYQRLIGASLVLAWTAVAFEAVALLGVPGAGRLGDLAALATAVLFCFAMRSYATCLGFRRAGRSWLHTRMLVLCFHAVPVALLVPWLLVLDPPAAGDVPAPLAAVAVPVAVGAAVASLHFVASVLRTRAALARPPGGASPPG